MSDAGSRPTPRGIDRTLDAAAKRILPKSGGISSGRFRPANYDETGATIERPLGSEREPDNAVRLSTFNGMGPSGRRQLFIRPDGPAAGQLSGWALTIEVKTRR